MNGPEDCARGAQRVFGVLLWPCLAIAFCVAGCGGEGRQGGGIKHQGEALLSALEQSEQIEVYTLDWPGERDRPHQLGVISRDTDRAWWDKLVADVRAGAPRLPHQGLPDLRLVLKRGDKLIAEAYIYPGANEIGLVDGVGRPLFDSAVRVSTDANKVFESHEASVRAAWSAKHGTETSAADSPREQVALPTPDILRGRLLKLFEDCEYVNIQGLTQNSVGINVRREGQVEWRAMTEALRRGTKGLAITRAPEARLFCEAVAAPAKLVELDYYHDMLSGADPALGGNAVTVQVPPEFGDALRRLHARAVSHEQSGGDR